MKFGFICVNASGHLNPMTALARQLRAGLLDEVLINSTYRANAQTLQRKIVEANGLSMAADLVEEALGVRKKPNAL